ncbi:hypothetical protein [Membranihabitans marinus]|uniref:hypothetical protein n=1 Tax=Membranihabitans marinus TaxID=1227546 RepID=UPI001F41313B|nr:hypothetical protein [Membranihabitans marinus]
MRSSIWLTVLVLFFSCQSNSESDLKEEGDIVAMVYGKKLYTSQLLKMMPGVSNVEDSLLLANALVDRWARKQILLYRGEQDAIDPARLNSLVEDYRESLIMHEVEEKILQQFSDTVVTDQQIESFVKENPSQFKLKKPIVKYNLAIFPKKSIELEYKQVKKEWDEMEDVSTMKVNLIKYLDLYAEDFVLDTLWYSVDDLQRKLPENIQLSLLKKSHLIEMEDDESYYFLKIIEIAEETDDAPLSYIRTFAQKTILQKRRLKWLEKIKDDLYQEAVANNKIIKYEN